MRHLTCAALAACLASPALAQSAPSAEALPSAADLANRDSFTLAVGAAVVPEFEGSRDYRIIPAGAVRGQYRGVSFMSRGAYLYVDVVPRAAKFDFDAGPVVGVRFGRKDNLKDPVVDLLPTRKTAIEVGAFAGLSLHGLTNPYDTLSFRVDVLHDVANAHKSTTYGPCVEFSTPLSRRTYASASVGAEFVSAKFNQYYFGITPAESLVSGLPAYTPEGGMKNWKAGLLLSQSITGDLLGGLSVFGYGQYSRLVGDARRSPIVALRGSPNQWLGAAGLAYTW
jgi:outer membrane protein